MAKIKTYEEICKSVENLMTDIVNTISAETDSRKVKNLQNIKRDISYAYKIANPSKSVPAKFLEKHDPEKHTAGNTAGQRTQAEIDAENEAAANASEKEVVTNQDNE